MGVQRITPLKELTLANSFMFGEVMRDETVCRLFLEALLQQPIARIEYIGKEQDISDSYANHGIRLDVYLADENGTRYDIEMQQTNQDALERRIRYYQSGIDRTALEKGIDYTELPESYVIFICDFDYYGKGLARYERVSVIKGREDISFEDGSHAIILNSKYQDKNVGADVIEFLDYIRARDDAFQARSELVTKTMERVNVVRNDERKEVSYMTWAMSLRDAKYEGRAEGRTEGREIGIRMLVESLRDLGVAKQTVIQTVMQKYQEGPAVAEEKVEKYW